MPTHPASGSDAVASESTRRRSLRVAPRDPDAEGGAAALALLHPGPTTMEVGEPRDEGEADPDAGVVRRRHRSVLEGPEDRVPVLLGDPRSVVLDGDQDVVAVGDHTHPYLARRRRVTARVHQEVLDDARDHLRIDPRGDRARVHVDLTAGQRVGVPHEQRNQSAYGDLLELRLD